MLTTNNGRAIGALAAALVVVLAGCSGGVGGGDGGGANQLGYAAGGANDVGNFRRNVENGHLPQPTDLTFEGLFHEYYFDTGGGECEQLFCPAYSKGVATDPLSNETEHYLTVGLNSNLRKDEFERKRLNLVVVVDTSGSMDSSIAKYAYDDGRRDGERKPKMAAARDAVSALTDHLRAGDRFGVVGYDDTARTVVPMRSWSEHDTGDVRSAIASLSADGGTNLDAGMERATEMVEPYADANRSGYETRVVYVTDAMPNLGDTSTEGLGGQLRNNARRGIYSTFVGVGVDFNSRLVESINEVEGANHYTVGSAEGFEERMDEGFEYMVTPLVFDLDLHVESAGYRIEKVYGSPSAGEATGELLHVNTLFPSRTENGSTKGGVILVQLERTNGSGNVTLTASYEDRAGREHAVTRNVSFGTHRPGYFESQAVHKAVLLSQYGDLVKNWLAYERRRVAGEDPAEPDEGIDPYRTTSGRWEQRSVDLDVSAPYVERLRTFREHFRREAAAIDDEALERELELLGRILNASATEG